jgi:beta-glucanase (GH16 family)
MEVGLIKGALFRFTLIILLSFQILSCNKDATSQNNGDTENIPEPEGWQLVWNDEFTGSGIDLEKWEYEVNADGGGNNELQYYTDHSENSFIENGHLVIQALKESYTGPAGTRQYTSARIRTKYRGDWKYGRFDIRAKLPYGKGLWPAIWMLPTDWLYGGWAASGEIDIMELLGQEPNKVYGALHYGGEYPNNVHTSNFYILPHGNFSDDFHVYSLEWESNEIRWYVDNVHYQTQTEWYTANVEYPAPFDQRFHILLNVAVGGNWPGDPDTTTVFPQRMTVDYIRVYRKVE